MSLDTLKLWRRKNFGFTLETTTGTPVSVVATNCVNNCFNPKITFETEAVERDAKGTSLSPILQYVGARAAKIEVETELVGGATQPDWCKLLRLCGMNDTGAAGTFLPVSGSNITGTTSVWMDGRQKIAAGCMGSFKLTLKRGQKGKFVWNLQGVAQPVVDAANPTPTYVTTKAPRVGAATFSVGGQTLRVPDVELDKGNVLTLREDIAAVDSAGDPTGYRSAWITSWKTMVRFKPESIGLSVMDFYALYKTTGTAAMSIVVGNATLNTFTISCPVLQLLTNPDEDSRSDIMTDTLEFMAVRNSAAGDDDLSIALT